MMGNNPDCYACKKNGLFLINHSVYLIYLFSCNLNLRFTVLFVFLFLLDVPFVSVYRYIYVYTYHAIIL